MWPLYFQVYSKYTMAETVHYTVTSEWGRKWSPFVDYTQLKDFRTVQVVPNFGQGDQFSS